MTRRTARSARSVMPHHVAPSAAAPAAHGAVRRAARRVGTVLLATATLTGSVAAAADARVADAASPATSPAAAVHLDVPTAAARAAGITTAGGAYMGWSQRSASTSASGSSAQSSTVSPALFPRGAAQTPGIDVASYQGNVDWPGYYSQGKRFAYVKATEGTTYTNPYYSQQYSGSYSSGMTRGAYHFARPDKSSGASQASYFIAHGGSWTRDGRTLPGALDIEYNPYGATCYGLSQASMVSWVSSFVTQYKAQTGVYPVIYSTYDWWSTCTGNSSAFSTKSPFWIARYSSSAGTLPAGYSYYTFWQYSSSPVDSDYFNGDTSRLRALALG